MVAGLEIQRVLKEEFKGMRFLGEIRGLVMETDWADKKHFEFVIIFSHQPKTKDFDSLVNQSF